MRIRLDRHFYLEILNLSSQPGLSLQVLPNSLSDALQQAGEATSDALQKGVTRCLVSSDYARLTSLYLKAITIS